MIPGSLILRNLHPIFWAYLALCLHRFAVEGIPWSINLNGFIFQQLINCYNVFFPTLIPNIFTVLYVCSLVFHLYIAVCYFFAWVGINWSSVGVKQAGMVMRAIANWVIQTGKWQPNLASRWRDGSRAERAAKHICPRDAHTSKVKMVD